jgi:acetyl esterase/lipase
MASRKLALITSVTALLAVAAFLFAAFKLSPWPHVWMIRDGFGRGAARASASIAPLVPDSIFAQYGLSYSPGDRDALLDVFVPEGASGLLPAIVWVHGGGFVAGSRSDLSGYLKILAARGFVTIAVDYTLAPNGQFPTPVVQTNNALEYVIAHADEFGVDPRRIFLAGDSAGAQIAAQTALVISDPQYAARMNLRAGMERNSLRGLVLYCGPYDPVSLNSGGPFSGFKHIVVWSYLGVRDQRDPRVGKMSVTPHVSATFPPVFISVGNADPLAQQSVDFANALEAYGVDVSALFFPADYHPPLEHEYQMLLTTEAGRLAFQRSVAFLDAHARDPDTGQTP